MKIKNKRNKSNCVNFKVNGMTSKVFIPAGKTVDISSLVNISQIINIKDFKIGFFEFVEEPTVTAEPKKEEVKVEKKETKNTEVKKKPIKKEKKEDLLDKVEKEVKDYTYNKNNK
jgi:hypothetical protein